MHKYLLKIISLLCVATVLCTLSACANNKEQDTDKEGPVYHTITFNTNGGTPVESLEVLHGRHAHQPENPTLENYIFCRWELADGRTWFFDSKTVTEDVDLEAVWIKAESLFGLSPMPDSDGIMITEIKKQSEFEVLNIPSVINGKTVVAISDDAFRSIHERYAKKIVFPDTITYIGDNAFSGITNVTLVFSGKISYIGEEAFKNNASLSKITLSEGFEKIPYCAFMGCTQLKTIDIPEKVTLIEENAFEDCENLTTIVLPSTLTTVESAAFSGCDGIKSVFFRGSVQQFDSLDIARGNDILENAKIYFYSEQEPTDEGMFWHYNKNGTPIIW